MIKLFVLSLLLVGSLVVNVSSAQAKVEKKEEAAAKPAAPFHAVLAKEANGATPASAFGAGQPVVYLHYQGETFAKGDKIRAVWVVVDAGKAMSKNKQVYEFTVVSTGTNAHGDFQLAKPATGWPLGKYRADVYVNAAKVQSLPFTIE